MHKIGGALDSTRITLFSARGSNKEAMNDERHGDLSRTQVNPAQTQDAAQKVYTMNLAKLEFRYGQFLPAQGKITEAYQALKATVPPTLPLSASGASAWAPPALMLSLQQPVASPAQEKSKQVDYLFERVQIGEGMKSRPSEGLWA